MSTIDKIRDEATKRAEDLGSEVVKQAAHLSDEAGKLASDPRPAYVVVGLTDAVVERARAAGEAVVHFTTNLRPGTIGEQVGRAVADVPGQVTGLAGLIGDRITRTVSGLQSRAEQTADDVEGGVQSGYDSLAERGQSLVERVRGQQATQELRSQVDNAVRQGKALVTTTRKGAAQTTAAAKATVTSGRKQAAEQVAERLGADAPARPSTARTSASRSGSTAGGSTTSAPAKKATASKSTAKKATASKSTAKKATASKPAAKKSAAKSTTTRKAAGNTTASSTGTAKKAAAGKPSTTRAAAKRTTTTARNRATETRAAAKRATTSATKAAQKATDAVTDAAAKVGD